MRVDVTTEIVIDRPIEVVWSYACDPANAPDWYDNIESARWTSREVLEVGSSVAFVARFLGRRFEYTYEIVELTPGKRMVMSTSEGPFPMSTTYTWTSEGPEATRMTLRNSGEPSGFSTLASPLMVPAMRRANRKDLANLKRILES